MDRKRLRTLHEIARHLSQSTGFGVVHLYNPNAVTQVHTDGSVLGLGVNFYLSMALGEEVTWLCSQISTLLENLVTAREQAPKKKKEAARLGQKRDFDRKRKAPRTYRPGALVLIEKQKPATGASRKIAKPL
nr:unnamed protein product [Callosobruchus analis]